MQHGDERSGFRARGSRPFNPHGSALKLERMKVRSATPGLRGALSTEPSALLGALKQRPLG